MMPDPAEIPVRGEGRTSGLLSAAEVERICAECLEALPLDGRRVLAIIPDHTRTAPVDLMFRTVYRLLGPRVKALDVVVALGTHHPLPMEQIYRRVGITAEEHARDYPRTRFFNHHWKDPDQLAVVGELSEEETGRLSGGMLRMRVKVTVNRMALEYDHLLIIGPVFPHEVVGFSGGSKYLFPGLAGQEILDFFHWLGALITNVRIIGVKHTPVRDVIEAAARLVPTPRTCLAMVVSGEGLAGLFCGPVEEAWSKAADLSALLHIRCVERPFHTVLSCAPAMYDDLWVGGKCMYKLEPVVADGGRLIIYAPHITEVSYTHGHILDQVGYHVRDYFVRQWDRFRDYPWGVLAHSTHVKGAGTFEGGVEMPRVEVILATGIPEERCRRINLGYMDPASVRLEDYRDREDEGILFVPKAGETLYRLKGDGTLPGGRQ
jgi:nickel-dependent lactate racemase